MQPSHIKDWTSLDVVEVSGQNAEGQKIFKYTQVVAWDGDQVFFGQLPFPREEVSWAHAVQSLRLIPIQDVYPRRWDGCSVFTATNEKLDEREIFVKRPRVVHDPSLLISPQMPGQLLAEARVLEVLKLHRHPNVVEYKGCVVNGEFIVGLALRRYPRCLADVVRDETPDASEKGVWLQGIEAAVNLDHSFGMAHSDTNPQNVMLNEHNQAVLVDFGSCQPLGDELEELGTDGFNKGFEQYSCEENGWIGLRKMRQWLGLSSVV